MSNEAREGGPQIEIISDLNEIYGAQGENGDSPFEAYYKTACARTKIARDRIATHRKTYDGN